MAAFAFSPICSLPYACTPYLLLRKYLLQFDTIAIYLV